MAFSRCESCEKQLSSTACGQSCVGEWWVRVLDHLQVVVLTLLPLFPVVETVCRLHGCNSLEVKEGAGYNACSAT